MWRAALVSACSRRYTGCLCDRRREAILTRTSCSTKDLPYETLPIATDRDSSRFVSGVAGSANLSLCRRSHDRGLRSRTANSRRSHLDRRAQRSALGHSHRRLVEFREDRHLPTAAEDAHRHSALRTGGVEGSVLERLCAGWHAPRRQSAVDHARADRHRQVDDRALPRRRSNWPLRSTTSNASASRARSRR